VSGGEGVSNSANSVNGAAVHAEVQSHKEVAEKRRVMRINSHGERVYKYFSSPVEEMRQLLIDARGSLDDFSAVGSSASTRNPVAYAAKMKAMQRTLGIHTDGSFAPLSIVDRVRFGTAAKRLSHRLRESRAAARCEEIMFQILFIVSSCFLFVVLSCLCLIFPHALTPPRHQ
jgi:hypothetical protein